MNHPCVLSLFLADGTADGLKVIEKSNWNGCGLACSKKVLFEKHLKEKELDKPGVYLLIGENDDTIFHKRLYIGEGDPVIRRLEDHFRKKDWWTQVIIFTSTDQTLNKAFVQYFEAKLVQLIRKMGRYSIDNANIPLIPSLSKRELAICEGFLREILLCLPLLGVPLELNTQPIIENDEILFIRTKGIEACGIEVSDGFVVLANSEMTREETKTIPEFIRRLRCTLIAQGIVREGEEGKLKFTNDHRFGSSSTASSVVLGRSSNGREVWKCQSGKTLKSRQLGNLDDN